VKIEKRLAELRKRCEVNENRWNCDYINLSTELKQTLDALDIMSKSLASIKSVITNSSKCFCDDATGFVCEICFAYNTSSKAISKTKRVLNGTIVNRKSK